MKDTLSGAEPETIGERLRKKRKMLGLSQEELANQLGISRTALIDRERDKTQVTLSEAEALSQILHVTPEWLCWGVNRENMDAHEATGLTNGAIETLKEYQLRTPPKRMKSLSLALSRYEILDALSKYAAFGLPKDKKGYFLSSRFKIEKDGTFVVCRMSPDLYKSVLGQNLLHELDKINTDEQEYPFEAAEIFDIVEEGGMEDAEKK